MSQLLWLWAACATCFHLLCTCAHGWIINCFISRKRRLYYQNTAPSQRVAQASAWPDLNETMRAKGVSSKEQPVSFYCLWSIKLQVNSGVQSACNSVSRALSLSNTHTNTPVHADTHLNFMISPYGGRAEVDIKKNTMADHKCDSRMRLIYSTAIADSSQVMALLHSFLQAWVFSL